MVPLKVNAQPVAPQPQFVCFVCFVYFSKLAVEVLKKVFWLEKQTKRTL